MPKQNQQVKLVGVKFVTPVFRVSFAHVFEPHKAPKAMKEKYSITMLFPKDGKPEKALGDRTPRQYLNIQLNKAAKELWGSNKEEWPKIERPFRDGDLNSKYKGYEGHFYCAADSDNAPGVVDRRLKDVIDRKKFYSGCYARAEVVAKAVPDVGGKNYVKFYLQHVMFWEDGEPFGTGGGSAGKAFAQYGEKSEDNDDDDNYDMEG